jgi:hypothetical protein
MRETLLPALLVSLGCTGIAATETAMTGFDGATQIWFRADAFDDLHGDVESVPAIVEDGLAFGFSVVEDSLTGNPMAFYGGSVRQDPQDWWLEYTFDMPDEGEWYMWGRAAQNAPTDNSLGSHFVWILGEFDDEIPEAGQIPVFDDVRDRIFADRFHPGDWVGADRWEWVGARDPADDTDPTYPLAKTFRAGENVVRIYERESGDPSVQFELFIICDDIEYRPTDDHARAALEILEGGGAVPQFVRGDPDDSGSSNITDAIGTLNFLFGGADEPACIEAADIDNDGSVNISDPIRLLNFLFGGGAAPPEVPVDGCGPDPAEPTLSCVYTGC